MNQIDVMLKSLEDEWRTHHPAFVDIKARYLPSPSADFLKNQRCTHGCELEILSVGRGGEWCAIEPASMVGTVQERDLWRHTHVCKAHGYARIFVTSGKEAAEACYQINPMGISMKRQ